MRFEQTPLSSQLRALPKKLHSPDATAPKRLSDHLFSFSPPLSLFAYLSWLGPDFAKALKAEIHTAAFGELLPGAHVVIETAKVPFSTPKADATVMTKGSDSVTKSGSDITSLISLGNGMSYFKFIVVVCAFRILTPAGDSMAWLDPVHIPEDWAYNTFRSGLQAVLSKCRRSSSDASTSNQDRSPSRNNTTDERDSSGSEEEDEEESMRQQPVRILVPDMSALTTAPGAHTGPQVSSLIESMMKQMNFAWKSVVQSLSVSGRRESTWADAILLQRLLLGRENAGESGQTVQTDLLSLLSSGDLEDRSLYSAEELQLACQWVRDPMSPERALTGAKLIANAFCSELPQFGLSRADISRIVTNKDTGCLPSLLQFVMSGQIKLYVEIPPEDLVYGEEIGTGTAGSVMRATWRGMPVAVKKFRGVDLGDFLKELSIMSIVQHPNLVPCYGGCSRNKDTMYIVQELMDCNVSDVLRVKPIVLDLGIRLRIAIEVAKGVSFLHSHCNLIHRDLKSLNLLATVSDSNFAIKVCDFGVSRVVDRRKTMTGNVGTVSWIAPEVFEQRKYTEKADVYSFGIVLWELLTRRVPFADIHSFSIPVAVIKGDRPSIPKDCPSALKKLIRECWQPKASKRPPFNKVIDSLLKIIDQTPPSQKQQTTFTIGPLMLRKKSTQMSFRHQKHAAIEAAVNATSGTPIPRNNTDSPPPASSTPHTTPLKDVTPKRKRPVSVQPESVFSVSSMSDTSSPTASTIDTDLDPMSTPEKIARKLSNMKMEIVGSPSVTVSALEAAADDNDAETSSPHSSNTLDSESPDSFDAITTQDSANTLSTSGSSLSLQRKALSSRADSSFLPSAPTHTRTVTCTVPDKWAPPIAKLEVQVNKYFSKLKQDLDCGTIMVNNERYLLFRAKSLAVDFFNLVQTSFCFDRPEQSLEFAQNFLYDLGTAIGKSDAMHFLASAGIDDPVARNNAGLVHIAYTGMAFIDLRPESTYSKHPEDECLLYEYTYSFESDSWARRGSTSPASQNNSAQSSSSTAAAPTDFCTCMMSAGYMSGWGEGSNGIVRATAEISCRSKGDHTCTFVRSVPFRLESMVRKTSGGQADPLPRFLKNRADTTQPNRSSQTPPSSSRDSKDGVPGNSGANDDSAPPSWFQAGFRHLFKRSKKPSSSNAVGEAAKSSTPQKFNVKAIAPSELTIEEIDIRASRELNSFFIDPTTATVEMADERCVLLRGDALAHGFFQMVQELFGIDSQGKFETEADRQLSKQFAWKFLFDLGKTIATSNLAWFADRIGLPANAIERLNSLPVNMAYFGWCDLIIRSGHSHKELHKAKENFVIVCEVANSFEAASWSSQPGIAAEDRCPVCYMHAGYLSGWFEAALKHPCVAVETSCGSQTGGSCFFTIAASNNIKKAVASIPADTALGVSTATAGGVLPLLAKFREKRRESTPVKLPKSFSVTPTASQVVSGAPSSPTSSSSAPLASNNNENSPSSGQVASAGSSSKIATSPKPDYLARASGSSTSSTPTKLKSSSRADRPETPPSTRDNGAPKRERHSTRSNTSEPAVQQVIERVKEESTAGSSPRKSKKLASDGTSSTPPRSSTPTSSSTKERDSHKSGSPKEAIDDSSVAPSTPKSSKKSRVKEETMAGEADTPRKEDTPSKRRNKDKTDEKDKDKDREKDKDKEKTPRKERRKASVENKDE